MSNSRSLPGIVALALAALLLGCKDRITVGATLAAGTACSLEGPDSLIRSWFEVTDSVALQMPDSVVLANPSYVIRSPSGSIGILDEMEYNIKLFASDGTYLLTVGTRGMGPGEIGRLHGATFTDDSTLLVVDGNRGRTVRYSTSGKLLGDSPGAVGAIGGIGLVGDRVLVGVYEVDSSMAAGIAEAPQNQPLKSARWVSTNGEMGPTHFGLPESHAANRRFLSRPPMVGRVTGTQPPLVILTWGWADSLYLIDSTGALLAAGALVTSPHFRPASQVSHAIANATLGSALQVTTGIVDLAGFRDRVYLSSVEYTGNEGELWYRIMDLDLRTIATDIRANMRVFPGNEAGLVGLTGKFDSTANHMSYSILTMNPCIAR